MNHLSSKIRYSVLIALTLLLFACSSITKSAITNDKILSAPLILAGADGITSDSLPQASDAEAVSTAPLLSAQEEAPDTPPGEIEELAILPPISLADERFFTLIAQDDIEAVMAYHQSSPQSLLMTDEKGMTALHVAALNGSVKSATYLLEQGAKVGTRDHGNLLAIDYAIANQPIDYNHAQVVKLLIFNKTARPSTNRQYDYLFLYGQKITIMCALLMGRQHSTLLLSKTS